MTLLDVILPEDVLSQDFPVSPESRSAIDTLADSVIDARSKNQPVIFFSGAHLIKNGLGMLLVDLIHRDVITLIAGNGATCIHDFELALIGETSEYVPKALSKGLFGMAYEFAYINEAVSLGNVKNIGLGESLGKMICEPAFRSEVFSVLSHPHVTDHDTSFHHPEVSVLAACYKKNIPFTAHAGIGTDVIDQHPSFDGEAKGGCSGRDFLIFVSEVARMTEGGVLVNIGSAVTGPEVFLKAASMAGNTGHTPNNIATADFDIRTFSPDSMTDEKSEGYYFRDQKSIVTRIPDAFNGTGVYIQGNQMQTFPAFYKALRKKL